MKSKLKSILPLIIFYSLQCFGQANGDYRISGTHSKFGEFSGRGWIQDGIVQRLVRYKDFKYEDKSVEEIWSGQAKENLNFSLKQSNLLTSFNGYSPSDESFKTPIKVTLSNKVFNNEVSFNLSGEEVKEVWSYAGTVSNVPLWKDLRYSTVALGKDSLFTKFVRKISWIDKIIDIYRDLPEFDGHREKPEFKKATQYIISDKTDADFYLQNPNVLRITNKSTNPLSLAEALMKRNAYGNTLLQKEKILRSETLKYNFNKAGMLETAIVDENGNQIGKQTEYDSALWSSSFGWAELLRYQVTKDPEALKNFKSVLNAILTLIEIPNDPKEFARSLAISPAGEDLGEGWIQGKGEFAHLKWRQGGNNDMVKGVFMTLILAHQVVREDEVELINRIQKNVKVLAQLNAVSERDYNYGIAEGLDALWNKDEKNLLTFHRKILNFKNSLGKIENLGVGIYFGGIADWSGIHLTMFTNFSQLLLAKELQTVFTEGKALSKAKDLQKDAQQKLFVMNDMYKNLKRDFLTIMIWSFIPEFQQNSENRESVKEALWRLREVPAPRSFGNAKADLSKHSEWSYSAWPRLPWKAIAGYRKLKEDFNYFGLRQGAYSYPIYESDAWNSTYFWKSTPYGAQFESNSALKTFSADYLLIYWASRASGAITAID